LRDDLPADLDDPKDIQLTGASRHISGDLGAEIQPDERRRNESCGDRCKSPPCTADLLCSIPMRRRDLAWLAVFADPFTSLRRPVGDIIGPARIILEDDNVPVPRRGFNGSAHVKTPILPGLPGRFLSTSPVQKG
jgi:hypothetical protein